MNYTVINPSDTDDDAKEVFMKVVPLLFWLRSIRECIRTASKSFHCYPVTLRYTYLSRDRKITDRVLQLEAQLYDRSALELRKVLNHTVPTMSAQWLLPHRALTRNSRPSFHASDVQ
jgi:hypothetical protein